MARSFKQSLLAAAVAFVVCGTAVAQTPLQEAVTLLRVNKREEAVAKLREILNSDPSNEDAHQLYLSVSQDEWYLLMTDKGEVQQIAQSILDRAKVAKQERSRDEEAIRALVDQATAAGSDYGTRQAAVNKLVTEHGEFAVPALVEKLASTDDPNGESQILAVSALSQLHSVAVLPLLEALKSSNDAVVQHAAAALHLIGDYRANPMMAQLANDARQNISVIARKFVAKNGVSGNAVDLMLAQANEYLKGNVPIGGYSDVVWKLVDDKLVASDVPALLYPTELAKACAANAVHYSQGSLPARSMLAQANLAEATLIDQDAELEALKPVAEELKIAALASGVDALRSALDAGVEQGLVPVAIGAIHALADAEIIDSIADSTLLAALESGDKRIKYAAADALVRASRGTSVPQANRVVGVLAEAVTEEKVNTIQVIAPTADSQGAVAATSGVRGVAIDASKTAVDGMRALLVNPNIDVVVINDNLPDRQPEDVIGNIKKDPRMASTRIVIVTKDEEAARERFGDEVGYVMAPLTSENLQAAVATALEGVESPGNARAEAYAKQASEDLLTLASRKTDIQPALANLSNQLMNRSDEVSVPAAKAIGLAGSAAQLPALSAALASDGSVELKKAAAEAIGNVLARTPAGSDDAAMALMAALDAATDVELRRSIAIALGKAKIGVDKKVELMKKLEKVASAGSDG